MNKIESRLIYLADKFNIFEYREVINILKGYHINEPISSNTLNLSLDSESTNLINIDIKSLLRKCESLNNGVTNSNAYIIHDNNSFISILLENKTNNKIKQKILFSDIMFEKIYDVDPSNNKKYIQWIFNILSNMLKNKDFINFTRIITEDLYSINSYLKLFDKNKQKKKFIEWSNKKNPSDINQYKTLDEVYNAVTPFIDKIPSNLEIMMDKFKDLGEAEIPYKDKDWTIYIPLTREASIIFDKFAGWCTAKPDNTMFDNYVNKLRPNGENSKIYIMVNNKLYNGQSNKCYQLHFETEQFKDETNSYGNDMNIYYEIIKCSSNIKNYFKNELEYNSDLIGKTRDNIYLKFLISIGYTEIIFKYLDKNWPVIKFKDQNIPELTDLSAFENLDQLIIINSNLHKIHPSIGKLKNLELLSLTNNNIETLPKEIGDLTNLNFINLKGNPIKEIPDEIKNLDPKRTGNLFRVSVDNNIDNKLIKKLKDLLPNVQISK